jgi:hypothetical protein
MPRLTWLLVSLFLFQCCAIANAQQDRAKLVKEDRANFDQDDYWIYNDLESGIAKAKQTRKPLLVVFR